MGSPGYWVTIRVTPAAGFTAPLAALDESLTHAVGGRPWEDDPAGFRLDESETSGTAFDAGMTWWADVEAIRRWAALTSAALDVAQVELYVEDHEDEPATSIEVYIDGAMSSRHSKTSRLVPDNLDELVRDGWLATNAAPRDMARALLALLRALDPDQVALLTHEHPADCAYCQVGETTRHVYQPAVESRAADRVLFRCDVCGDIFENFVDGSFLPQHLFRVDADGNEIAPCAGNGHPLLAPPRSETA